MYQGRLNRRTSEMGGVITVVKGKGVECEKCTDGIMKILHTICLKHGARLFCMTLQPTTQHPTPIRAPRSICPLSPFPRWCTQQHCSTSA
ncbi:hypothetical protein V8E53_006622 [Lactarius tabidus]